MRESLGGSMLLNLVVIFTGLIIIFFVGILSYSKAYRVKNRIVEIIASNVDVVSITIVPTIAITQSIIIVSITTPVSFIKLLSSILLKNVACTSTPG